MEKICEAKRACFYGREMYRYKYNFIQICPNCRKLFKGRNAELMIFKPDILYGGIKRYNYQLHVPEVIGTVDGLYFNDSFNISTVRRKLKRLLGKGKLKITRMNCSDAEYEDAIYRASLK